MRISFKSWFEDSYAEADVPEHFYVACKLNLTDLLAGRLIGLQGLTSDPYQVLDHVRTKSPVVLKLPSKELIKLNNLTRILYDNPDYLVSKGLDATNRISASKDKYSSYFINRTAQLISGEYGKVDQVFFREKLKSITPNFNNVNELVKQIIVILGQLGVKADFKEIRQIVISVVGDTSRTFQDEREWRVKPKWHRIENELKNIPVLRLPKNTEILVSLPLVPEQVQEDLFSSGLDRIYKCLYSERDLVHVIDSFVEGTYKPNDGEPNFDWDL